MNKNHWILMLIAVVFAMAIGAITALYFQKPVKITEPVLIYVPGEPQIEYRDTTIYLWKEKPVESKGDTLYSDFDSTFVSFDDTISFGAIVEFIDTVAWWTIDIEHKHAEKYQIDTIKIPYPEFIEVPVKGMDFLSYTLGIGTAILIWILTLL